MKTRDQLLEECTRALFAGEATLEECVACHFAADPDAADLLRTIVALHAVSAPPHEATSARERVRLRLMEQIDAAVEETCDDTPEGATWAANSSSLANPPRRAAPASPYLVAAALLLISALGVWYALAASESALPNNPLYGIKRGAEWVELRSAWSDERRGSVLADLASRRVAEAQAEAALHNDATVRSLATELDSTMGQLIELTASMQSKHENATSVALALAQSVQAEYTALQAAQHAGQSVFADALDKSLATQQQAIRRGNLTLPVLDDGRPGSSGADPRLPTKAHGTPPVVPPGHAPRPTTPTNAHSQNPQAGAGNGGKPTGGGNGGGSGSGGSTAGSTGGGGTAGGGSSGGTAGGGGTGGTGGASGQHGRPPSIAQPVVSPTSPIGITVPQPMALPSGPAASVAPPAASN